MPFEYWQVWLTTEQHRTLRTLRRRGLITVQEAALRLGYSEALMGQRIRDGDVLVELIDGVMYTFERNVEELVAMDPAKRHFLELEASGRMQEARALLEQYPERILDEDQLRIRAMEAQQNASRGEPDTVARPAPMDGPGVIDRALAYFGIER